jgi:hypothetical protein
VSETKIAPAQGGRAARAVVGHGAYAKGWRVVDVRWSATSWYKILPGSIVPGTTDQPLDDARDFPEIASVTRAV